ncbi:hypothetical protein Poly30_21800 [Planctomycetes bacterium Poly30]|uniref:SLA1 homology domain-containing protein n=1 Tax=Saltatorellus ferox TaxID=2528018 RepID=A0A518ERJ3_9BACT|nr:hypothetical protein Poly30_21800 [Planctomycetes bacterium Poly30]
MISFLLVLPLAGGATLLSASSFPAHASRQASGQASGQEAGQAKAGKPTERERELLARVRELEAELREVQINSLRRQEEWIEYTRVLQLFSRRIPEPPAFIVEALKPAPDPLEEHRAREEALLQVRADEILRSLRSLLMTEGVRNLDILEVGRPVSVEGRAGTGPVIGRLLDDRGRMVGMIKANRMRLEPSRSGRTITIVMEDGYESRQGVRQPFEGGTRRLFLGSVDPEPWIEAFPDLMDDADVAPVIDDGLWDLVSVRSRLARLLAASSEAGGAVWRLAGIGGIREGQLRDVQFAEIDSRTGQVSRRVFADSGRIRTMDGRGIEISLTDGTVRRGDRAAPFLEGRFRLMLPYADADAWRAAELPGLSPPRQAATQPAPASAAVPEDSAAIR